VTVEPGAGRATGTGRFYALARTVTARGLRVDVEDKFTNLRAGERVAIMVEHRLACGDPMPRRAWIGGSDNPSLNQIECPQNPTLFVPVPGHGLGIVLRDDVFRVQGKFFYDASGHCVGVRTDSFALDRGASYTLRWSLYVVGSHDYFDFINRVRDDWGVNTTIHGPYAWRQARSTARIPMDKLRQYLRVSQVKHLCIWSNPNAKEAKGKRYVAIGSGAFYPQIDATRGGHLAQLKAAVERVHEAGEGVKVLLMTNCFLNSVPDKSQTSAFEDSWHRSAKGKLMPYRAVPTLFPTHLIYPTPRNSWGRRFAEIVDYYLDTCGADGIYWDEMTAWGPNRRLTFGAWDGHTAQIDPETKAITRLVGLVPLLSAAYRRSQVDRVRGMGKVVHANGAPEVATLQTACNSRMVETKFVPIRVTELHLTTPLAYTHGIPTVRGMRERLAQGGLCFRVSIVRPSPVMTRLFPFTPQELHAGWMQARERIITSRSGRFGWDGAFAARVWRFDAEGQPLEAEVPLRRYEGRASVPVHVPADGLAIVVRGR